MGHWSFKRFLIVKNIKTFAKTNSYIRVIVEIEGSVSEKYITAFFYCKNL